MFAQCQELPCDGTERPPWPQGCVTWIDANGRAAPHATMHLIVHDETHQPNPPAHTDAKQRTARYARALISQQKCPNAVSVHGLALDQPVCRDTGCRELPVVTRHTTRYVSEYGYAHLLAQADIFTYRI